MLKIQKQSSFPRIDSLDDSRNTYIYYIGAHTRAILYPLRKRNRGKGRFKSHKTFVSTLLAGVVYCVRPRARDFELNLKSGDSILWQPGVKCRSVAPGAGLSPENSGILRRKLPKGRYRFTPQVAIQDAEDRSIPFSIWTSCEKARKKRVKGHGGHYFILLTPP